MALNRSSKDSGLAWFALIGAFITNFMYGAMSRSFGELYVILLERFHGSDLATSGVGALNLIVVGVAGFGMSLTYVCSFLVVDCNFDRLKATAMALAVTGSGIGCFAFPPILESLYATYGYEACLLCLASVSALLLLNAIFYRRPGEPVLMVSDCSCGNRGESSRPLLESTQSSDTDTSHENVLLDDRDLRKMERSLTSDSMQLTFDVDSDNTTESSYWDWQLLKDIAIWALLFQNLTVQSVLSFCSQYTPAFAIDQGIDPLSAAFLLSTSGAASAISPLLISIIMDLKVCRPHLVTITNGVVAFGSVMHALTPLPTEFTGLLFVLIFKAGTVGLLLTQRATLAGDLAGPRRIAPVMGLSLFADAIGSLIGRTTGGAFKDSSGSYDAGFYLTGGLCFFGCIFFQFAMKFRKI